MSFSRWKTKEKYTWSFQVFRKHHSSLNALLWSQIPAAEYVTQKAQIEGLDIHTLFSIAPDDKRTVKNDVTEWVAEYKEFNNWVRLNALMSLSSYLEVYLVSVISMAIESDPGILHNATKKIDGALLLKYSDTYSHVALAKKCTVGVWTKRIKEYNAIFRHTPAELTRNQGELEKIRKLRNKIGHAFGRDIEAASEKGVREIKAIERLSQNQLKKYLGIIYEVVKGIDNHLHEKHIGSYEIVYGYYKLKKNFTIRHLTAERAAAIRKGIGKHIPGITKGYSRALVEYYDKL